MMAFGCLVGSIWCAADAWWISQPVFFWMFVAGEVILLPVIGLLTLRYWSKKMNEQDEADKLLMKPNVDNRLEDLIGQLGQTVTPLTPGGLVQIGGDRVHASSEGLIVDRGETVRVISVRGNRLVVRVAESESDSQPGNFDQVIDRDADEPLDFDVSES